MKKLLVISGCFWILFLTLIVCQGHDVTTEWLSDLDRVFPYYSKTFYNHTNLIDCFMDLSNIETSGKFFIWCCDFINYFGRGLGYDYQEINIIVFVIIQPMIIINLIILLLCKVRYNHANSN